MPFNLGGAVAAAASVLLGSALAVGAAALPANATAWQDTALYAYPVHASTFSGGTLAAANGTNVNPNGTGAQLRGGTAPTPWGGSVYTWTDYAHLPR